MIPQDLIRAIRRSAWAILPDRLEHLTLLLAQHFAGMLSDEDVARQLAKTAGTQREDRGVIAVLPVHGMLMQRGSYWATGSDELMREFQAAVDASSVKGIVLDIDSPGGEVYGIPEFADVVLAARAVKPVFAVANSLAASAAYWIGSQAAKLFATPGGDVGSIGVWTAHLDMSKAYEDAGLKVTLISEGKYKTEGNPWEPLSDEGRAALQDSVRQTYDQFVAAVARGRGVTPAAVEKGMGQGRVVTAQDGLKLSMIDGVATVDQVIAMMQREIGATGTGRGRAAAGADATGVASPAEAPAVATSGAAAAAGPAPTTHPENDHAGTTEAPSGADWAYLAKARADLERAEAEQENA